MSFNSTAAGLIREGLFLASLSDHPNILNVHAWSSPTGWEEFIPSSVLLQSNTRLYDSYLLVLERLQGGTLKRWIQIWNDDDDRHRQEEETKRRKLLQNESIHTTRKNISSTNKKWRNMLFGTVTKDTSDKTKKSGSSHHSYYDDSLFTTTSGSEEFSPNSRFEGDFAAAADFDYDFDDGHPYPRRWPSLSSASLRDRLDLLLQLTDTVKYLHKHQIIHRDLKRKLL